MVQHLEISIRSGASWIMGLIHSLLHRASAYTRGIPEWAPHNHDMLGRNVPWGAGVESRLGFGYGSGFGRRWHRRWNRCATPSPLSMVPYTPYARVAMYPPAWSGASFLRTGNPFAYSSFNGVPYANSYSYSSQSSSPFARPSCNGGWSGSTGCGCGNC